MSSARNFAWRFNGKTKMEQLAVWNVDMMPEYLG